jgi:hypothetical protein
MKVGMYIMAPESIRTSQISPISLCVRIYISLLLLGNGLVKNFT